MIFHDEVLQNVPHRVLDVWCTFYRFYTYQVALSVREHTVAFFDHDTIDAEISLEIFQVCAGAQT